MSCTTFTVPRASRSSNSCSNSRAAARHDLIAPDAVDRWLRYRDNRNDTAHDYGEDFAEATLRLLPDLIQDAKALAGMIERTNDD